VTGACFGHEHPEWFDDRLPGENDAQRAARHRKALAVCSGCEVRAWCLSTVQVGQDGVRGGQVLDAVADRSRRSAYAPDSEAAAFFKELRGEEHRAAVSRQKRRRTNDARRWAS